MYLTRGFKDIDRHCEGRNHVDKLPSIRSQQPIQKIFVKKNSETNRLVSLAEVRFARFLAEHNLPFAAADHLKSLIRVSFPDSKSAQASKANESNLYSDWCHRTRSTIFFGGKDEVSCLQSSY